MSRPPQAPPSTQESVKETLISIIIAFAMAFVFRGFVIEAFVIPTGSMAPTLMGAHMRFQGTLSGRSWAVGPWFAIPPGTDGYLRPQLDPDRRRDITVHDPMTGEVVGGPVQALQSGDRILVLKYVYALREPRRYDVIVFKNPTNPAQNYIKRLIGLPGEHLALVDGDVFVHRGVASEDDSGLSADWDRPGWTIARKPALQQEAVWQPVFDSALMPESEAPGTGREGLGAPQPSPWSTPDGANWSLRGRSYESRSAARTELVFDQTVPRFRDENALAQGRAEAWTIDDRYAYNEVPAPVGGMFNHMLRFPVSDLRVRAGVEPLALAPAGPGGGALKIEFNLRARRHDFQGLIDGETLTLRMRELAGSAGIASAWRTLATGRIPERLRAGRVTEVAFTHADQRLTLSVGSTKISAEYEWTPAERIFFATGRRLEELLAEQPRGGSNILADARLYARPEVRIGFEGGPVRLTRVGLDRDLHYQPTAYAGGRGGPALATSPERALILGPDQFFACGDNSPASLDGRLWDSVDDWVAQEIDDTQGIVPRDLLLGRAFFVYWPSLHYERGPVPVPDFGRMRFIW